MGVKVFTRFFGGTILLEGATPVRSSRLIPKRGDVIYDTDGSVLQVQTHRGRLVEAVIDGPPRPIKLPSSWYIPATNPN